MNKHECYMVNGCIDFIPVKVNSLTPHGVDVTVMAKKQPVKALVDQVYQFPAIHEPQKVVVPKFVAEWIEKCKDMNCSLRDAMKNTKLSAELNAWFLKTGQDMFTYPNQETFARAWLDGFEIEKEQLYTVEFPTGQRLYKNHPNGSSKVAIVIKFAHHAEKDGHFTKRELEEAGFGWVFDCSGVKVVEVE